MKQLHSGSRIAVMAAGPGYTGPAAAVPAVEPQAVVEAVEAEIRAVFESHSSNASDFWGMCAYHLGWADFEERPAVPGKRLRPLLTVLSASAVGGDWRDALPLAAAIELLHNFSLIHDDIQDGSPLRRGRPSVWAKWGVGQAINAGDSLFALAHLAVQRDGGLPAVTRLAALALLDQTCVALARGQYLDMAFETRTDLSVEDYLEMAQAKTAALTGLATEFGGLAASADDGTLAHLQQLGAFIGLAFQVRDDILGIWGEPAATGKPACDIATRKKTLPIVYGLQASAKLRAMFEAEDELDVREVTTWLEAAGALAYSVEVLRHHVGRAFDHLGALAPEGEAGSQLSRLVTGLLLDAPDLAREGSPRDAVALEEVSGVQ